MTATALRRLRAFLFVAALAGMVVADVRGQAGPPPPAAQAAQAPGDKQPPTLTEAQRLTLETKIQALQLAELRLELARRDLVDTLKALQVDGYTLDLQTMTYVKREPGKPPEPPK